MNITDTVATMLRDLITWLMGVPAGLKLNSELANLPGQFFSVPCVSAENLLVLYAAMYVLHHLAQHSPRLFWSDIPRGTGVRSVFTPDTACLLFLCLCCKDLYLTSQVPSDAHKALHW